MKHLNFLLIALFAFTGCGRIDSLTWEMTPEKWFTAHSYYPVIFGPFNFILAEPSSTFFVYSLGVVITAAGIYLLKNRENSKSRLWWCIGFFLWGAATFSAGTSYQAFSYEIKCAGKTVCSWTSWWEIWYLILFVASMNAITSAVAFSSASGKLRRGLIFYSAVNCAAYLSVVLAGAFIPQQFMVSFECMLLFASPTFLILLTVNAKRYLKFRNKPDLLLMIAWIFMFLIVIAYFLFYISGYAAVLWEKGIWFNANDVLHIGLIFWILYVSVFVMKEIRDVE